MWRSGCVTTWPSTRSSGVNSPGWCWGWVRRASPPSSPTPGPGTSSATGSSTNMPTSENPLYQGSHGLSFSYSWYCIGTLDVNVFRVGSDWIWIFLQHSVWILIRKIINFIQKISVADPGCLSRIPDPGSWFLPIPDLGSRISDPGHRIQKQQQKREVKKISCHTFLCSHKFHKIVNYFSFEVLKKKIWANFQRIIELFTKKIVKKLLKIWSWDPGSGKKPIPDPGSRGQKAPNPGSRIRIRNTAKNCQIFPTQLRYPRYGTVYPSYCAYW